MKRKIDPEREIKAVEKLSEAISEDDIDKAVNRLGYQCKILDAVDVAMRIGASQDACAEYLGLTTRTLQRWRSNRLHLLMCLDDGLLRL